MYNSRIVRTVRSVTEVSAEVFTVGVSGDRDGSNCNATRIAERCNDVSVSRRTVSPGLFCQHGGYVW